MKNSILAIALFFLIGSSNSQNNISSVKGINSYFKHLMPIGKTNAIVDISISEFQPAIDQAAKMANDVNDTVLSKQLSNFFARVNYNILKDSISVELSPLKGSENPTVNQGLEQFKSGYYQTVFGGFLQIKSIIFRDVIDGYISEPTIENLQDNVIVNVVKKESNETYTFSPDFKDVKISGTTKGVIMNGLLKSHEIEGGLVVNYAEFIMPQIKGYLYFTYSTNGDIILPSTIMIKNEMPSMKISLTYSCSRWTFN